ncbi:hypothetical protein [Hyphomicrobium methylovorum]|uniref:hypothetical protein n=1 Tax=Hyphomicrobium methylovorum TaxID=84 RepID=UPI0015E7D965|nr:hypothetical protein [Hyphomicrobium methylovorum]
MRDAKEADALFQELESVAQVPSFATMDARTLACRAWSENHAQAKRIESLGFGKNLARTQHETQQQENERLLQKLEDGREDAAELSARLQRVELAHQSLQTEHSELKTKFRQAQDAREGEPRISSASASQGKASHGEVITLQAKLAEADKRADLLLLQLQQVQDELEHYFLKYRELSGKATPSEASDATPTQLPPASVKTIADVATAPAVGKAANASPSNTNKTVSATAKTTNLTIDMRHFIDGENWYFAEDDGRWSGPGTKSVLRMPPLSKGRYSLELDIVDAMSAEIVHGLRATLDGKPLSLRFKNLGRKNGAGSGAMASVKQLYKEVWRREPVWPVRASGELEIDTPTTERRSTLELQFPNVISPASRGGLDDRALAIRLKQARICSI